MLQSIGKMMFFILQLCGAVSNNYHVSIFLHARLLSKIFTQLGEQMDIFLVLDSSGAVLEVPCCT